MTARVSISSDNLSYLQSLAQAWGCDQSKAINYLLFQLRTQSTVPTTPTAQFVQIPAQEMYRESVPVSVPTIQAEPEVDETIARFIALGLDEF
jgi:hypothetical protein